MSVKVKADDSVIDKVNIRVPVSCTLTGVGMNSHTAEIQNGTYNSAIGETTLKAFCNDTAGFAIYAIGYTDEEDGKNVLTNASLGSTYDITTGTATSGNDSKWAMKLSVVSSPTPTYPITIQNSFDSFHAVPDDYTLVAKRTGGTDTGTNAEGSTLKTTYQVYVSSEQPAGTYTGKVKYTLVHPNDIPTPKSTMLDTGRTVRAKMKSLASGTETDGSTLMSDIKAIRMADSLPGGFVASDANTVSASTSRHPIYIFFDNTNDAGIMYFYTGGYQVVMNPDSNRLFGLNLALSDISGLATWDSSNVTNMQAMFLDDVSLTNLDALSNWNVSKVTDLMAFLDINSTTLEAGYQSQLTDISGLASWDTSSVENLQQAFQNLISLRDISALVFWNTSNVTNMFGTFAGTGMTDVDALSNWDVSKVENMSLMFCVGQHEYGYGVRSQLGDISGLANWDTGSVTEMGSMFAYNDKISSLNALSNWDTSNVEYMRDMFLNTSNLMDASAIRNWDVRGVTVIDGGSSYNTNGFHEMFKNSGAIPESFTLRPGAWNSNGTYIPSS